MPRIRLALAALAAILLIPAVALAADGAAASEQLAGVIAMTLGIVLGLARLLRASEDALHALLPEKLRWVPAAVLLALGGASTALPAVTDWWGYAAALLTALGVVVVAATRGHQEVSTSGASAEVTKLPANARPSSKLPPTAAMVFLLATGMLGGCTPSLAKVAAESPSSSHSVGVSEEDAKLCRGISRREMVLRRTAEVSAALGGGTALTTIPVEDRDVQTGLAISAGTLGAVAVGAQAWRAEEAADFERLCQ